MSSARLVGSLITNFFSVLTRQLVTVESDGHSPHLHTERRQGSTDESCICVALQASSRWHTSSSSIRFLIASILWNAQLHQSIDLKCRNINHRSAETKSSIGCLSYFKVNSLHNNRPNEYLSCCRLSTVYS